MEIDSLNKKFRTQLANRFTELVDVLANLNINSAPITSAIKDLKNERNLPLSTPTSWGYSISNLTFRQDPISGIQYPKESKIKSIKISLDLIVKGEFRDDHIQKDPFQHLEFNLVVEGLTKKEIKHILCFHLDRQPDNSDSQEAHPAYHIHVGGHRLKTLIDKNFGNSLFMGSPRLKHYPMDLVLGIDFITSNFCPELNKKLRREQKYIKLLKSSQELVLKPYYYSISKHFGFSSPVSDSWNAKEIFPQLL